MVVQKNDRYPSLSNRSILDLHVLIPSLRISTHSMYTYEHLRVSHYDFF